MTGRFCRGPLCSRCPLAHEQPGGVFFRKDSHPSHRAEFSFSDLKRQSMATATRSVDHCLSMTWTLWTILTRQRKTRRYVVSRSQCCCPPIPRRPYAAPSVMTLAAGDGSHQKAVQDAPHLALRDHWRWQPLCALSLHAAAGGEKTRGCFGAMPRCMRFGGLGTWRRHAPGATA